VRAVLLLVLLSLSPLASAQVYRWVDDKGRVNYSSEPPPQGVQAITVPRWRRAACAAWNSAGTSQYSAA
jgi:hypothetical protein